MIEKLALQWNTKLQIIQTVGILFTSVFLAKLSINLSKYRGLILRQVDKIKRNPEDIKNIDIIMAIDFCDSSTNLKEILKESCSIIRHYVNINKYIAEEKTRNPFLLNFTSSGQLSHDIKK